MVSKSKSKSKNKNKKKQTSQASAENAVRDDIILIVTLLVSVLLLLSFFNLSGPVGRFVSSFLFGLIGLQAYLLPFLLFFGVAFIISNLGNKAAIRKFVSALVLVIALAGIIELLTSPYVKGSMNILDYYKVSSQTHKGGGIIGGILVLFLCGLFDVPATYVILIAIMIIAIIVMSGKALITFIAKKSKSSLEEKIENQKIKKEEKLESDAINSNQDIAQRRPPKTFLIDNDEEDYEEDSGSKNKKRWQPGFMESKKNKKAKAEVSSKEAIEDLPKLNLGDAFDDLEKDKDQEITITYAKTGEAKQDDSVPTYEDELRSKFGDGEENVNQDISTERQDVKTAKTASSSTTKKATNDAASAEDTKLDIQSVSVAEEEKYLFPPINMLKAVKAKSKSSMTKKKLKDTAMKLQNTLESFGVNVTITNVSCGPTVTRYELQPEQGVKVSKITSLADDIKLNLATSDIRIEAPIPGKAAVGIEVPNDENSIVSLREMVESDEFKTNSSKIAFTVGRDIGGNVVIADIAKMPHMLIAGATGSGKSVCINTIIMSILYKAKPSEVRLILIDPKVVELNVYNGIPHLLIPVVTDPKKASSALNWAVSEMTERYKKFADLGSRDIKGYNERIDNGDHLKEEEDIDTTEEKEIIHEKLPQIVIIIDELADLMMVASNEVEDAICRLAQLARACGIHLIIATQRPSVNVITGLIKANIPSRIAFEVSSAVDSRTILDGSGAEKLLGKGDMLFFPSGYPKPIRVQGTFVSEEEVHKVVEFLKDNTEPQYNEEVKEEIDNSKSNAIVSRRQERDEYFAEAGRYIVEQEKASIGMLQRVYRIGFNRAARMMDQLADAGVVGPEQGTKPRDVLMTMEEYEQFLVESDL